jgi:hypothetical protein
VFANFPSKQGLFSSLVGAKLNDQELLVRQQGFDRWLREVLGKAMSSPRQRMRDVLKVFLEWRSRRLIMQGTAAAGVGGAGVAGSSGMMAPANINGAAGSGGVAEVARVAGVVEAPVYAGEAEVVAQVPETSAPPPPFNPNVHNNVDKDGNAAPVFVPTADPI